MSHAVALWNPFAPTAPAAPPSPSPKAGPILEHLPGMADVAAYLEGRMATVTARLAELRRGHSSERQALQRESQELEEALSACRAKQCDPWKYEGRLLTDLMAARGSHDTAQTAKLRGLLRAGSWWTHERVHTGAEAAKTLETLWHDHPGDDLPHRAETLRLLRSSEIGAALEPAVAHIEERFATWWRQWKLADAAGARAAAEALKAEIGHLRAVRDYLYIRRLYPLLARHAIGA
jgi:hypothetical protein